MKKVKAVYCNKKWSPAVSSDLGFLFDVRCILKEAKESLARSNFYVDGTLVLPLSLVMPDQIESVCIQMS